MGQGGCGRRELVVEAARQILRCVYTVRVSVWVFVCVFGRGGGQRKKFVCAANKISKICIP